MSGALRVRIRPCQREKDQPGLEFANPGGGRGHIHGLLPTPEHDLQGRETRETTALAVLPSWDLGNPGITEVGKDLQDRIQHGSPP